MKKPRGLNVLDVLRDYSKEALVEELKRRIVEEKQEQLEQLTALLSIDEQVAALQLADSTTTRTATKKPARKAKKNPAVAGSMKKLWAAAHKAGFHSLADYKAHRAKQSKAKPAKAKKAAKKAKVAPAPAQ